MWEASGLIATTRPASAGMAAREALGLEPFPAAHCPSSVAGARAARALSATLSRIRCDLRMVIGQRRRAPAFAIVPAVLGASRRGIATPA